MKRNLLKITLALMATVWVGGVQAQDAPDFGTEEVVSEETTWVFNNYETGYKTEFSQTNKLYLRAYYNESKSQDFRFNITATEKKLLSFSDGYTVEVEQCAVAQHVVDPQLESMSTANSVVSGKEVKNVPMFAINVGVPGKFYVLMKESGTHDSGYRGRIYYWDGTTALNTETINPSTEGAIYEATYDVTATGSVFVGSTKNPSEIYAIRFVPTATKADKIVYIGATSYMTFSDANKHYSTPDGLSAYGAKAANGGNAVELIPATNIKKQNGYILKGTPNTNYKLTELTTGPTEPKGNELKRQASAKTFSVDGDGKDSENNYNYILAADNGVAKFFAVENGTTLAVGKAWLQTTTQLTPAVGARGISIIFSDETTGIETVQSSKLKVQGYYNLAGQRVAQPAKGLYIVNGKKIMIK